MSSNCYLPLTYHIGFSTSAEDADKSKFHIPYLVGGTCQKAFVGLTSVRLGFRFRPAYEKAWNSGNDKQTQGDPRRRHRSRRKVCATQRRLRTRAVFSRTRLALIPVSLSALGKVLMRKVPVRHGQQERWQAPANAARASRRHDGRAADTRLGPEVARLQLGCRDWAGLGNLGGRR